MKKYIGIILIITFIFILSIFLILRKPLNQETEKNIILDPSSYSTTLIVETEKQKISYEMNVDTLGHDVYVKDNYFEEVEEALYRFKYSEKQYICYTFECDPDSKLECKRNWIEMKYDLKTEEEVREKDISNLYLDMKKIIQENKIKEGETKTIKEISNTYFRSYISLLNNIKLNDFKEFSFYYSMKENYINGVALTNSKNEKIQSI